MGFGASIRFLSFVYLPELPFLFLMLGISVPILFFVSVPILFLVSTALKDWKAKRTQKKKDRVRESSEWLRRVQELNSEIHYYEDILGGGHSTCSVEVNSKAKYDKTNPSTGLYEAVRDNRQKIEWTMDHTSRNRVINEMYQRKLQRLCTVPTQQQCEEIGVTMEQFLGWEQEILEQIRLRIPTEYTITCFVTYTSPQGRNYYSKHKTIGESEILELFRKLDSETTLHASEAWRRKTERAKVTPAVRFRIIQRDGGRCCVCGRSAQDGVELEVDHIIPISRGGDSRESNLQTLCRECNRGKGSTEYELN